MVGGSHREEERGGGARRLYLWLLRDDELVEQHPSHARVVQDGEGMYVDLHTATYRPVRAVVPQLCGVAEEGARDAPPNLASVPPARDEGHAELLDVSLDRVGDRSSFRGQGDLRVQGSENNI